MGSFTCRKVRHGTDGFTCPPKDFFALKIRRLRPGLIPRTRVPEASTLTPRPPKPMLVFLLQNKFYDVQFSLKKNLTYKIVIGRLMSNILFSFLRARVCLMIASHSGKDPRYKLNRCLAGPQPVWTLWGRQESLAPAGNRTTVPRTSSPFPSYRSDYALTRVRNL